MPTRPADRKPPPVAAVPRRVTAPAEYRARQAHRSLVNIASGTRTTGNRPQPARAAAAGASGRAASARFDPLRWRAAALSGRIDLDNPYDVLGVPESADALAIVKAYRRRALATHPDKNRGDHTAPELFRRVAAAYETLSDPNRRHEYDTAKARGGSASTPSWEDERWAFQSKSASGFGVSLTSTPGGTGGTLPDGNPFGDWQPHLDPAARARRHIASGARATSRALGGHRFGRTLPPNLFWGIDFRDPFEVFAAVFGGMMGFVDFG